MKSINIVGHEKPIVSIKFNREDDLLFSGAQDRKIAMYSTETNERIGTFLHDASVNCMTISPDSKYLISGDNYGGIYIWSCYDGKRLGKIDTELTSGVSSIDLGVSDSKIVASLPSRRKQDKGNLIFFDINDVLKGKSQDGISYLKDFQNTIINSELGNNINHCKFMNANTNLLCALDNGFVQVLDLKNNGKIINEQKMHDGIIMDLDLTLKEELALVTSKDKTATLFDPETLKIVQKYMPDHPKRNINSGKISPLFSNSDEGNQLYHVFLGGGQESREVTFTSAAEGGFELLIYDLISGEEISSISDQFSPINTISISNSGKMLAYGGEEANVKLYHLNEDYFNLKSY